MEQRGCVSYRSLVVCSREADWLQRAETKMANSRLVGKLV